MTLRPDRGPEEASAMRIGGAQSREESSATDTSGAVGAHLTTLRESRGLSAIAPCSSPGEISDGRHMPG